MYLYLYRSITFILAALLVFHSQLATTQQPAANNAQESSLIKNREQFDHQKMEACIYDNLNVDQAQINLIEQEKGLQNQIKSESSQAVLKISPKVNEYCQQSQLSVIRKLQTTQSNQTSNKFIWGSCLMLQWVFILTRNLILVGLFTNSLHIFIPYLLISESFCMLGFWACKKHYLSVLFANIFTSPCDLLNAVRLFIQPSSYDANLPQLAQYGFSSIALCSIAGELFVALILLALMAVSRNTTLSAKYQWMKNISKRLRPVCNNYFMAITPRVATLTGLHLRDFGHGAALDSINGISCSVLFVSFITFFTLLLLQTRQAVQRQSQGDRQALGLASRIDDRRQFSFDCFEWSSLYYPCMNFIKILVYFLLIGLAWDCKQLSYGAPILCQFFTVMVQTTSPSYSRLRDRISSPIFNFFLIVLQLCIITVGLIENAPYAPLSEDVQIVMISVLIVLLGVSLSFAGVDFWNELNQRCKEKEIKCKVKNDKTQNFALKTKKTEESDVAEEKDKDIHQENIIRSPVKTFTASRRKIKKVRTNNAIGTSFL